MPYRTVRVRAPLFMTHKGARVYRVFKHDDADGDVRQYAYTFDPLDGGDDQDDGIVNFDARDLTTFDKAAAHDEKHIKAAIRAALDKGEIVPDIDVLLKGTAEPANVEAKAAAPEARPAKAPKARPAARDGGKRPRDPRNPFRPTSAYAACFDILAAHPDGMPKDKLVQLLAGATGKDAKHAAFDAQVLLSARGNEPGLSRNDGPRHRSCRPGFWVRRTNGHVQLVVD